MFVRLNKTLNGHNFNTDESTHIYTFIFEKIDNYPLHTQSLYRGEYGYFIAEDLRGNKQVLPIDKKKAYAFITRCIDEYAAMIMIGN